MGQLALLGAGGAGGGGPTVLLKDTFTDTDGTNLTAHTMDVGSGWSYLASPAFTIQSNQLACNDAHATQGIAYANAGQANVTISCDLTNTDSGAWPALSGRLNPTDGSRWDIYDQGADNTVTIYEFDGTTYTERASASITTSGTHTLTVVFAGNTITVSVDGMVACSYSSATRNNTQTNFGIEAFGVIDDPSVRFDNFQVTTP